VLLIHTAIGMYTSPTILRVMEMVDAFSFIARVIVGRFRAELMLDLAKVLSQIIITVLKFRYLMYLLQKKHQNMDKYM